MKRKMTTKQLVQIAVIAAMYAALTALFMAISFTPMQLRVSEIMVFLAYFNPISVIGLTIGCFLANLLMSPTPVYDCIFGTLATFLSVGAISLTAKAFKGSQKGVLVAAVWPVVFNAVIVGAMLFFAGFSDIATSNRVIGLIFTMGNVGLGELIVIAMGSALTLLVMKKYKKLIDLME